MDEPEVRVRLAWIQKDKDCLILLHDVLKIAKLIEKENNMVYCQR